MCLSTVYKNTMEPASILMKNVMSIECKDGQVILTDLFWSHEQIDSAIYRTADEVGYPLVRLGDLGESDENMAKGLFEHSGVAAHPGDLGMYRIAERITEKIVELLAEQV